MSAAGKSPPTTYPSGSASPLEGGACCTRVLQDAILSLIPPGRSPLLRHPGQAKRDPGPESRRRLRRHSSTPLTTALRQRSGCHPGFGTAEDRDPVPPNGSAQARRRHERLSPRHPRATICPSGYWTPACAGVTAEEVAIQSRLTPAEVANGSRLSGFACGRDDLREEETPSPLSSRHPGRASRDPGPIGFQSGGDGSPPLTVPTRTALSFVIPGKRSATRDRRAEELWGALPETRPYPPGRQSGAAASVIGARAEVGQDLSSDCQVVLLRTMEQRARRGPSGPRRQTVSPSR